jgi:ABC-type nitrate/sulfonate/bicarbonate transport system substrate-binding protein
MKSMFARSRHLALCTLAVTFAGCGAAAPSSPAAPSTSAPAASASTAPTKLVVGLGQAVAQVSPLWVAQDAGFYTRNGLDIDARVAVATTGLAALLSGELTFHIGGGSEMLNGVANGAELVALANLAPKSALRFEAAASIKTKDDLIGKKLGITRIGSATHTASLTLLRKIGLDPDKDVSFVQLNTTSAVTTALIAGAIQGAMCSLPECLKDEAAGLHPMYNLAQLNMLDTTAVVVAVKPWVTAHRDVTQRFIDGLVEGVAREKKDKPLSTASLKKNMKIDDQAALNGTYDFYVNNVLASEPYSRPEQFADVVTSITAQTGS